MEAQKANDEALLSRMDSIREELPKLDEVIETLSPEKRERKLYEERINRMDESINSLNESLGNMKEMLEMIIKRGANGNK